MSSINSDFGSLPSGKPEGVVARINMLLNDYGRPAVLVLDFAVLDAAERVEQFLRHRTGLLAEGVALAGVEVVDV